MLYYLSGTRYLSNRAHAIQQARMCEAFQRQGEAVTLLIPQGSDSPVTWDRLAEFYGLRTRFTVTELPTFAADRSIPFPFVPNLDIQLSTYWLLYRYAIGELGKEDVLYSRTPYPVWLFCRTLGALAIDDRPAVWFEQHQPDRGLGDAFYQTIDGLVTISRQQAETIDKSIDRGDTSMVVAHDGVDLARYDQLGKAEARAHLDIGQDDELVVYTGQLYPDKDVETFVRAMEGVKATGIIVGGTQEAIDRIRETVEVPPNVAFVGAVPPEQVVPYQVAADILVGTVARETTLEYYSPLKLFEYMATGNPLIITRKPAYEEVVTHEKSALLVPPESVEAMRSALNRLVADPLLRQDLGRRARETVTDHTWDTRAKSIIRSMRAAAAPVIHNPS